MLRTVDTPPGPSFRSDTARVSRSQAVEPAGPRFALGIHSPTARLRFRHEPQPQAAPPPARHGSSSRGTTLPLPRAGATWSRHPLPRLALHVATWRRLVPSPAAAPHAPCRHLAPPRPVTRCRASRSMSPPRAASSRHPVPRLALHVATSSASRGPRRVLACCSRVPAPFRFLLASCRPQPGAPGQRCGRPTSTPGILGSWTGGLSASRAEGRPGEPARPGAYGR
jgi:hypothetical protein